MRILVLLSFVLLPACGWVDTQRSDAAAAARDSMRVEWADALATTRRAAERHARGAERILSPLPVMTPRAEAELRRFRNGDHVASARALGVRAGSDLEIDSLETAGLLEELPDSAIHWIVRRGARGVLVPDMRAALEEVGARFHARLAEIRVPPYRFEITSGLRTAEEQARLRQTNSNAARGVSSHEFGTTVDLSYAAFAPPAELPDAVLSELPPELTPHMDRLARLAMESVSGRKSRELGAIFSEVLAEMQAEGRLLVLYERQQTVYHVTLGPTRA